MSGLPDDTADLASEDSAAPTVRGYLVTWKTPAGKERGKWYQRQGNAENKIAALGERGEGLEPKLFRAEAFEQITDEDNFGFNAELATARRDWARSPWRKKLVNSEPDLADLIRSRPKLDKALQFIESRFTRAGRESRAKR